MTGNDSGHYKPRKRTYGDALKRGDDDDFSERSKDGSKRHHRPSLLRDDFSTAGRVRGGNESPFVRKESFTAGTDSGHYRSRKRPGEDGHCGERGRDGSKRHHRPSLPRDDFSKAGRVRSDNESPFARKECMTAGTDSGHYRSRKRTYGDTFRPEEDDDCGGRGRDGWERPHRPSRPCNDFSTSGRVRGGNDSPFVRKELKTAGTDSGHYKSHKRTHGDLRRPVDYYCGQRDIKRDRRDSAKDEGGSRLRCELRDRRNSVVAAVASNEVRGTVKAQRDCRDETHCASRDQTETCARTERGANREIKVGKSSNVSNPATVYSRIQAMQASQMKVTEYRVHGGSQ
ncbi:hypothetical protein MRX96_042434 [Rhipicephalus microplus]